MAGLREFGYEIRVEIPQVFAARQEAILFEAAEVGVARAKAVAPVDTGRLRDSIVAREYEGQAAFGSEVPYAGFQEFGTSRIAPRRYIYDGFETALDHLRNSGYIG